MKLTRILKRKPRPPKALFKKFTDLGLWIDQSGNNYLSKSGYTQLKSRAWINETTKPEYTILVRFSLMKGGVYSPFRHIHLLYVPDIENSLRASKITFSRARLAGYSVAFNIPELEPDLQRVGTVSRSVPGKDFTTEPLIVDINRYDFGYYQMWKRITKKQQNLLFKSLCEQIVKSDAELKSNADILKVLEAHRAWRTKYADNFVDPALKAKDHLAYALTLAKIGNTQAAKNAYDDFCVSMKLEYPHIKKLQLKFFADYLEEVSST